MEWYDHQKIEKKWQNQWEKDKLFRAEDFISQEKSYVLVEFPYPSGDGLHVGHVRSYAALDAVARKRRLEGKNVLYPIGWDAFGLPTENYAIKTGVHPRVATDQNIATFRRQLKSLGISFDWSREVDTSDPAYYRWTQWIFLILFRRGLAYQATIPINWCPSCKIGLANEEVVAGKCERCGTGVIRKMQKQWMLRITAYADRLLADLDTVDYLNKIKTQQINWIGRSEGAEVEFRVEGEPGEAGLPAGRQGSGSAGKLKVKVFTTRPDTLFGATYLVVSPEHQLVEKITTEKQHSAVQKYIHEAARKSDIDRTDLAKEKTGVFTGAYATNPVNDEKIPIWIADYVLASYGTGAIMAVPAHDERDLAFAQKFDLPIRPVIQPPSMVSQPYGGLSAAAFGHLDANIPAVGWTGEGVLINSGTFNGTPSSQAAMVISDWLEADGNGKKSVQYKLRDWVFSRQHYWGEPIPIIHCPEHGAVSVPEDQLPVALPHVEKYQPTDTGESPLAKIDDWVNTQCPMCKKPAKRETDTMPNWAGSSWYFLRYCDPHNDKEFAQLKKLHYWMPVDIYNGGMEHTVLHLLYSRFWYKVLADEKLVPANEPYRHRHSHGIVLAEDGRKMSKSFGNVINPDDIVREYGADSLRIYEMFMGPFEDTIPWSTRGIIGVHRFLQAVHDLFEEPTRGSSDKGPSDEEVVRMQHHTVKRVSEDFEHFRFNTAVSGLMEYVNLLKKVPRETHSEPVVAARRALLLLLFPMAPHLTSELWERVCGGDINSESWPTYDAAKLVEETIELVVQVNGKVRGRIANVDVRINEENAIAAVQANERLSSLIGGYKKVIFVPKRLINFIV